MNIFFDFIKNSAGRDYSLLVNPVELSEQFNMCHEEIYALIRREGWLYGIQLETVTKDGFFIKPY